MEKDEFKKKVLEAKIFQELKDDIKINTICAVLILTHSPVRDIMLLW